MLSFYNACSSSNKITHYLNIKLNCSLNCNQHNNYAFSIKVSILLNAIVDLVIYVKNNDVTCRSQRSIFCLLFIYFFIFSRSKALAINFLLQTFTLSFWRMYYWVVYLTEKSSHFFDVFFWFCSQFQTSRLFLKKVWVLAFHLYPIL